MKHQRILAAIVPGFHISGDVNSRHYWREQFDTVPTVTLDGEVIDHFCEAKSGPEGFVIVEVTGDDGKPRLAHVVLDGEVVDQVIAKRTLRGAVIIKPTALRYLKCRRVPGSPNELIFTFSHTPSDLLKSYIADCMTSALTVAARPTDTSATSTGGNDA